MLLFLRGMETVMGKEIKQERIHCEEVSQIVKISSYGELDKSTDVFIPYKHECSHQKECDVYYAHAKQRQLCPALDRVHEKYISILKAASR